MIEGVCLIYYVWYVGVCVFTGVYRVCSGIWIWIY